MSKSKRIQNRNLSALTTTNNNNAEKQPAPSSKQANNSMTSHYAMGTGGGAVKRIRTPLKNDVLCGRGGGINSHPGNQSFRDFVKQRKNDYNLAQNKAEKARVAREVVDLVQNQTPAGRFLERESDTSTTSSGWWIECSMAKALSKTSQALREGAPSIRAAHQHDVPEQQSSAAMTTPARTTGTSTRKTRATHSESLQPKAEPPAAPVAPPTPELKRTSQDEPQPNAVAPAPVAVPSKNQMESPQHDDAAVQFVSPLAPFASTRDIQVIPAERPWKKPRLGEKNLIQLSEKNLTPPSNAPILAPLLSNREFEGLYGRPVMTTERMEAIPEFDGNAPTPPPEVTPPLMPVRAPELPVALSSLPPPMTNFPIPMPRKPSEIRLQRTNSLALSDVSSDFAYNEFVNPFEDESYLEHLWGQADVMFQNNISNNNTNSNYIERNTSFTSTSQPDRSRSVSNASFTELADLGDSAFTKFQESEFSEGMKMVHDAVHPGLSSPSDESIPTHLYPFRGSNRRLSTVSSRSPLQGAEFSQ